MSDLEFPSNWSDVSIPALRTTLELEQCNLAPYDHQVIGIDKIVRNPFFFLADEMGAGKTLQSIVAAQILYARGIINRVIVVAPSAVRSVWYDEIFGEITKHSWNVPKIVHEYHSKPRAWGNADTKKPFLHWVITNYEFIRGRSKDKTRLRELLRICTSKTLLILDESSAVKSHKSEQTDACRILRKACGRVLLLNGTPVANNPSDLYSQAEIMDPAILACKSFFQFRARYAVMGGYMSKQIVGWRGLDDLQKRMAPYVIRRLKVDCLDLPEKLESVTLTVPLSPKTWAVYKQMKDDMVAWLNDAEVSSAQQAIVKAIRLAQITSGFVGGVEELEEVGFVKSDQPVQEVGSEKLDLVLDWLKIQLENDPKLKLLVWCRFRPEVERLLRNVNETYPDIVTGLIWGGQKREDRDQALRLLDPRTTPDNSVVVIGTPATGSMGLNLTAAHTVIYVSNDFSLKTRLQSEDRVHRPGQTSPVSYFDVVATGPSGQQTVDHLVIKSLRAKKELAEMTTAAWIQELSKD